MDSRTFDDMTRALAAGVSRRRVLAGVAGTALGLLGRGRIAAQETDESAACAAILCLTGTTCCPNCGGICVPIGTPCSDDLCAEQPCGNAICGPGEYCCNESCSICAPIGGACTEQFCGDTCAVEDQACNAAPNGCCDGLTCTSSDPAAGVCAVLPPPSTCQTDADCLDGDADPCTGATCTDGTCAFFIVDCVPGHVCCGNGECCPFECQTTADCPPDPTGCNSVGCTDDGRCVSTLIACTCATEGAPCGDGCCDGLICLPDGSGGATCQGCAAARETCGDGRACCRGSGLTCQQDETDNVQGVGVCVVGGPDCMPDGAFCDPEPCCDGLMCEPSGQGYSVCVVRTDPTTPAPTATATATPTTPGIRPPATSSGGRTVRTLPNTGRGAEFSPSANAWLKPLVVAAGAAAVIADRLRPGRQHRP